MRRYGIIWTILLVSLGLHGISFAQVGSTSATTTFYITATVPGPPGGGGGGEDPPPVILPTEVSFSGFAYPGSLVTILKDGQFLAETTARIDSRFDHLISGLTGGTYLFSLSARDVYTVDSTPNTYSVAVASSTRTTISGIVIAPTVSADKIEVKQGDPITFLGQGMQDSTVTIVLTHYGTTTTSTTTTTFSIGSGLYQYVLDTTPLVLGNYGVSAKWSNSLTESPYSRETFFIVGKKNVTGFLIGDVNYDDRVDIADFSMTAFWYRRTLDASFITPEFERLNGDGMVTLADFSLMAYYWTG